MTSKLISACLILVALVISQGPNTPAHAEGKLTNPPAWQSTLHQGNQLVGKIWSRSKNGFITPQDLLDDLKTARFILLGEIHDNPDHHWLQAKIIAALTSEDHKPAIVMEMIRVDQMRRFNSYMAENNPKAQFLGNALQWEQNGWPTWSMYQPIGEQIVGNGLEVYPGHPSRMTINHLIKSDLAILPEEAREVFRLTTPLPKPLKDDLAEEIRVAHCNRLPENVIPPMTEVQRFRDAWMADVMIQASEDDQGNARKAILIAGSGHTRDDRGAPWYLREREGPGKSRTVQFIEAGKDAAAIKDIAQLTPDGTLSADYFWVTPAPTRGDPCDKIPDFGAGKKQTATPATQQEKAN